MPRDRNLSPFKPVSLHYSCEYLSRFTLSVPYLARFGKVVKNCSSSLLGDLNLLLGSVKCILIARSWFVFIPGDRIWKHFCLALHIWLILFTLKANYIWWKGKMEFRNMGGIFFMNFHGENVGGLFSFPMPPFMHGPAEVIFLSPVKWVLELASHPWFTDSQPGKNIPGHPFWLHSVHAMCSAPG